ncbi:alpha-ketoacid dehydrogenase subunit beta [Buchananella hordeovulneris]|uniref:Alpha-ketoacid dehydrogenase subunit beta n=1 Tax=Buchananella hordeovulneris TaxID=52770 RepID=A0A1Q5PU63_9ACTO|nr:transketolase C-terminal domain-containing protein [Buchananella hordeovulneris]OKL51121.1 alpha-ketoacid dehydrogenase subunit beta [Buchananella hordeovulneris]
MTRQTLTMVGAINAALALALAEDPHTILLGEDIGQLGGVFRVTDGLQARFGAERVRDTPLAEAGIVGTAIGMAQGGYRPVVEIQFDGFVFPAFNQITTQLAKMQQRTGGAMQMPVTIRIPFAGGIGAVEHHSESPEVYFMHTPGLRVITPGCVQDAFTMTYQAIMSPDPVILLEPKARYWDKAEVDTTRPDISPEALAYGLHSARVVRPGSDITLVAYGPMVRTALAAAAVLAEEGKEAEVVDLRSLNPLDVPTLVASAQKTGRVVVMHEASTFAGPGAEIAAAITEGAFTHLYAPVARVGGFHTPYPPAKHEHAWLPSLDRVLDAVDRTLQ